MIKLKPNEPRAIICIEGLELRKEIHDYLDKRTEGKDPEDIYQWGRFFYRITECILGDENLNNSVSYLCTKYNTFDWVFRELHFVDADHNSVSIEKISQNQGILVHFEAEPYCHKNKMFIKKHLYIPLEILYDLYEELKALYPEKINIYWGW